MLRAPILIALLLALIAAPAARAQGDLPDLPGAFTVEAASSGFVDVELPVAAAVRGGATFAFVGGGDAVAVTLRSLTPRKQRDFLEVFRFGPAGHQIQGTSWYAAGTDNRVLPAGGYRLYVHTAAPVSAHVVLPGVPGDGTVRPTRATSFEARTLLPLPSAPGVTALGGRAASIATGSLWFTGDFSAPDEGIRRSEVCIYGGSAADAAGPAAYQPGCPLGGAVGRIETATEQGWRVALSVDDVPGNSFGLGANVTTFEGTATAGGALVFRPWQDGAPVVAEGPPVVTSRPAPAAPPTGPAVNPGRSAAVLASARLRRAGRHVLVRLRCPGPGRCRGAAGLDRARARAFDIAPRRVQTVRVAAPRAVTKRLRRARRARATLVLRNVLVEGGRELRIRVIVRR